MFNVYIHPKTTNCLCIYILDDVSLLTIRHMYLFIRVNRYWGRFHNNEILRNNRSPLPNYIFLLKI